MNKWERRFDRFTHRYKLNPSRWIPHLKPEGIYEMGTQYPEGHFMKAAGTIEEALASGGTEVPVPCFSIYSVFETICRERARERLDLDGDAWIHAKLGFWHEFWGFLAEVDMGVYDTTDWVQDGTVELPSGGEVEFRYHSTRGMNEDS